MSSLDVGGLRLRPCAAGREIVHPDSVFGFDVACGQAGVENWTIVFDDGDPTPLRVWLCLAHVRHLAEVVPNTFAGPL